MIVLLLHLLRLLPFLFGGQRQLVLENMALRQQLAVYRRTATRPRLGRTDRLFWAGLARVWAATCSYDGYLAYYNTTRPQQSLHNESPHPREVHTPAGRRIVAIPQVGGLHHRYQRAA